MEEMGQIIAHKLDSGKERIVGLRTDGVLMIWNWENGEWTAFMSPTAAGAKGLAISPALLAQKKQPSASNLEKSATCGLCGAPAHPGYRCVINEAQHQDRAEGSSRWGIMR